MSREGFTAREGGWLCIRDFKNRGRGGSETRPEVIFPISDEERMRVAFSPELENAA